MKLLRGTLSSALPLLAAATTTAAALSVVEFQKQLPACSLVCLAQHILAHGCELDAFACQCARIEPIIRTASPCMVRAGCDLQSLTAVGQVVFHLCKSLPDEGRAGDGAGERPGAEPAATTTITIPEPTVASGAAAAAVAVGGGAGLALVLVLVAAVVV